MSTMEMTEDRNVETFCRSKLTWAIVTEQEISNGGEVTHIFEVAPSSLTGISTDCKFVREKAIHAYLQHPRKHATFVVSEPQRGYFFQLSFAVRHEQLDEFILWINDEFKNLVLPDLVECVRNAILRLNIQTLAATVNFNGLQSL